MAMTRGRALPNALALVVIVLALVAVGCGDHAQAVVVVRDFTFVGPSGETRPVRIPVHVDDSLPKAPTQFTLRARVALPPEFSQHRLTLAIPFWQARSTVRVNGVVARSDDDSNDTYRALGPTRWSIEPVSGDAVDLEIVVDHTWTQGAWLDSPARISATVGGDPTFLAWRTFHQTTTLTALVTILLVALSYSLIFFSGRKRRAAGWFALEALAGAGYPAFYLGILPRVLGTADVSVVASMLALSGVANVHFVHAHCKLPPPSRAWWALLPVSVVVGVIFVSPFEATRGAGLTTVLIMLAIAAHEARIFVRLIRRGARMHEWIVPLSWPLACVLSAGDFAAWVGMGGTNEGMRVTGCLGVAIVSLMQSIGLSREYILALNEADTLNTELSHRVQALQSTNTEIQHLNAEMRRHIAHRSQSLVEALGRVAPASVGAHDVLAPGVLVSDRYRVIAQLGQGGMGAVFEVERARDGRRFALKAIARAAADDATLRLAREAEIVSHIDHPNVVGVIDVDVTNTGLVYVVLELVDGPSLDQLTDKWGDLAWAEEVLPQIARGLEAIHRRGIVHRDLKPSNILIESATGRVKIADFGISSLGFGSRDTAAMLPAAEVALSSTERFTQTPGSNDSDKAVRSDITKTGMVMGTPLYMAPELLNGARDAQPSADVFSFGIIAYELLTGRHPFGEAPITRFLRGDRTPPALEVDARAASLLRACLSFEPSARPSAEEIVGALDAPTRDAGPAGEAKAS